MCKHKLHLTRAYQPLPECPIHALASGTHLYLVGYFPCVTLRDGVPAAVDATVPPCSFLVLDRAQV